MSAKVSVATEQAAVAVRKVAGRAAVAAEPHLKKSQELYDQHLKEHMNTHVYPLHKKHILPLLPVISKYWQLVVDQVVVVLHMAYAFLAKQFNTACPNVADFLLTTKMKYDSIVPNTVIYHVEQACSNPEASVTECLWGVLYLLALIFRAFVWRTAKSILFFPFRVVWYFLWPLRWIFGIMFGKSRSKVNSDSLRCVKYLFHLAFFLITLTVDQPLTFYPTFISIKFSTRFPIKKKSIGTDGLVPVQ